MANQGVTPRGLYKHAVAFSAAAEVVLESYIFDLVPTYFLWGRAIELMLKSFLLAEGVSAARLKSKAFGHDLVALMRAAEARGIASLIELNHTYRGVVQLLNFDFTSKRFEYYITDATYLLPNITPTRQLVKRLLKEVDSHLKSRHGI